MEELSTNDVEVAIRQVERLYRSLTGADAPSNGTAVHFPIPVEKDPQRHVEEQIERLLGALGAAGPAGAISRTGWTPPLHALDAGQELILRLDLPGVPRESMQITAAPGILSITGERPPSGNGAAAQSILLAAETPQGAFQRLVRLPPDARLDGVVARLRDGVLEVRVPRTQQAPVAWKPIQID